MKNNFRLPQRNQRVYNRFTDAEFAAVVNDIGLDNGAAIARKLGVTRQAVCLRKKVLGIDNRNNYLTT
jgi:hypothetical protein